MNLDRVRVRSEHIDIQTYIDRQKIYIYKYEMNVTSNMVSVDFLGICKYVSVWGVTKPKSI